MKFRIKVEKIDKNKYKHIKNIMIESDDIEQTINKIKESCNTEIQEREKLLLEYIIQRQPNMIQRIIKETDNDLIDWNSKGWDISKEEFLANEMELEVYDK